MVKKNILLYSLFKDFYTNRFGRENFQEAMKVANRVKSSEIDWSTFKYVIFDAPNHRGTYQERYSYLGKSSPSPSL